MKYCLLFLILGMNVEVNAQSARKPAVKKTAPTKNSALTSSMARGSIVYTSYCLACHQADAGGVPNMNPPLTKTEYVLGDKKRLINIILNGLNEEVKINDETYSNPMPPHNFLTDEQIADVLTYVRNNFGNKASLVNKPEVAKLRK
ncbi:MAG: cytochrome c [Chitinophagaceae bacterium]